MKYSFLEVLTSNLLEFNITYGLDVPTSNKEALPKSGSILGPIVNSVRMHI